MSRQAMPPCLPVNIDKFPALRAHPDKLLYIDKTDWKPTCRHCHIHCTLHQLRAIAF